MNRTRDQQRDRHLGLGLGQAFFNLEPYFSSFSVLKAAAQQAAPPPPAALSKAAHLNPQLLQQQGAHAFDARCFTVALHRI